MSGTSNTLETETTNNPEGWDSTKGADGSSWPDLLISMTTVGQGERGGCVWGDAGDITLRTNKELGCNVSPKLQDTKRTLCTMKV